LSANPNAVHLLERNLDKIEWHNLSGNPSTIRLLEQNPDKIHWNKLSANPNAVHLLERNQDKIHIDFILENPAIFTYDYAAMKRRIIDSGFAEELMQNRFHPRNIGKFVDWGFDSVLPDV
jgi:hypothetical protein